MSATVTSAEPVTADSSSIPVLAIIGARLNSSRLPGKHLLPLAGLPMIERVVQRLAEARCLCRVVLATTADEYNQPLVAWAEGRVEVVAYAGDVNDLMGRVDAVVQQFNPEYLVYICGDCPLVDPEFIDHALTHLIQAPSFDTLHLDANIASLHEGMAFYSRSGWARLMAVSNTAMAREHVGYGNKLSPVLTSLAITDSHDYSRIKHRISVDTPADYRFMQEVYRRWYASHPLATRVSLEWVQAQLLEDPELRAINGHVQQKQPHASYKKVSLFCHVSAAIGMGHVRRCSQIADALQEYLGLGTVIHVVGEATELPWLSGAVSWHPDTASLLQAMSMDKTDLWVLDFHPEHMDLPTLASVCAQARESRRLPMVGLDKLSALIDVIDFLFIPAFYADITHPKASWGWQNYLFTPRFAQPQQPPRLLVLTGGSDALGFGAYLPALLESLVPANYHIHWVQGPYAPIPSVPASNRWHIHRNPPSVADLIASASRIITCYGQSLFEAIASGATTLLLPADSLCSAAELQQLQAEQCCLISNRQTLADDLAALFDTQSSTLALGERGLKRGSQINGVGLLVGKIRDLLNSEA